MVISERVRETLKAQVECPGCGVSWVELEDSLNEGMASPNCYVALLIIRNCHICLCRFQDEVQRLKGETVR